MNATVASGTGRDHHSGIARRYESLVRTHRRLEEEIGREGAGPAVDTFALQEMKRRKLRAKDAMTAIERQFDRVGGTRVSNSRTY